RETMGCEQREDHVAEQCPLGIDLRGDRDPSLSRTDDGGQECCDRAEQQSQDLGPQRFPPCAQHSVRRMNACRTRAQAVEIAHQIYPRRGKMPIPAVIMSLLSNTYVKI